MGWASRKTLANFWRGVRSGLEVAVGVDDVVAADAIVGNIVMGLRARDLQDWSVQVVHFFGSWGADVFVGLSVDVDEAIMGRWLFG
jgi:hypothetical protein